MDHPQRGCQMQVGWVKLRFLTGQQVSDSYALPPKICVHPTVIRDHDDAVAEECAVSSTTLVVVNV